MSSPFVVWNIVKQCELAYSFFDFLKVVINLKLLLKIFNNVNKSSVRHALSFKNSKLHMHTIRLFENELFICDYGNKLLIFKFPLSFVEKFVRNYKVLAGCYRIGLSSCCDIWPCCDTRQLKQKLRFCSLSQEEKRRVKLTELTE